MAHLFNSIVENYQRVRDCYNVQFDEISQLREDLKYLEKMNQGLKQNLTICEDVSFNKIRGLTRCLEKSSGEIDILKRELIGKEEKITKRVAIELTEKYKTQIKHLIEQLTKNHNERILESGSDTEYHSVSSKNQMEHSSTKSSCEIDPSTKSLCEIDSPTKSSCEYDPSTKYLCEIDSPTKSSCEIDPSTKYLCEIDSPTKSSCEIDPSTKSSSKIYLSTKSSSEIDLSSKSSSEIDSSTKSSCENDSSTKSSYEVDPSTKSSCEVDPSTKCSCEIDPSTKCSCEIDSSTKSSSEIDSSTRYSSEIDSSSDGQMENNVCFNDGYDTNSTSLLLSSIEEYCCSNEPCDPMLLLEKCKTTISNTMKNVDTWNAELRRYRIDAEFYLIKFREEQKVSADKQSEICAMKTLNTLLADELKQTKKFPTDDELKDELKNVQCCLKMRMDENKRLDNDLCQMKQLLEESDKINQELEEKISRVEVELKSCEALKRSCDENCNNLSIQCSDLQLDLATEKKENREMAKTIDDLCEKTHYLKDVITGLNSQILLNEEKANARIDCLITEKDRVACENKQLKNDIGKLCQYTESLRCKQADMENRYRELEADKRKLAKNIDSLKKELKCTLENEVEVENNLSVAYKEVKLLKLSIECYEKTAENERQKLVRAEQQLQDTKRAQLSMNEWNQEWLTCVDTEIGGIPLSSRHDELSLENEELAKTNALLGDQIARLEESVRTLQCANNDLTETIKSYDDEAKTRRCHAESMAHFDLQTDPCPAVECPHVCDCSCDSPCDCEGNSDGTSDRNGDGKGCEPAVSSDCVADCAGGAVEACDPSTTKCDCAGVAATNSDLLETNSDLLETNRLLRCELDEMQRSCEQNEADTVRRRLEMECELTRCRDEIESLKRSCAQNGADTERRSHERELEVTRYRDEIESLERSCEQNGADTERRRCEMESEVKRYRDEIESLERSCEQNGADTERRRCEMESEVKRYRDEIESLKRACKQNKADAKLRRCEMEWKLLNCQKEVESQTVSRMAELTARLEASVALVARLEKDLKNCHNQINQLKKNSAEFEQTKEIQEQLKHKNERKKSLENKSVFDYEVQENGSSEKDRNDDLNNEIKSSGKKVACKKKKPEKKVTRKPFSYGPRIDLPCCIGSENPCNRPQLVEKWNNRRAAMQNLQAPSSQHRRLTAGGNSQPSSVAQCAPLPEEMIELMSKELDRRIYAHNDNKSRSTRIK